MSDSSFSDDPHQIHHQTLSALPSKHIQAHELRDRSMELNIKYRNGSAFKHYEQNQMTNSETIFATYILDKELISLRDNELFLRE